MTYKQAYSIYAASKCLPDYGEPELAKQLQVLDLNKTTTIDASILIEDLRRLNTKHRGFPLKPDEKDTWDLNEIKEIMKKYVALQ